VRRSHDLLLLLHLLQLILALQRGNLSCLMHLRLKHLLLALLQLELLEQGGVTGLLLRKRVGSGGHMGRPCGGLLD